MHTNDENCVLQCFLATPWRLIWLINLLKGIFGKRYSLNIGHYVVFSVKVKSYLLNTYMYSGKITFISQSMYKLCVRIYEL